MANCPPDTYLSSFVGACASCPDVLSECYQENKEDSVSCARSCASAPQPPIEINGNDNSTNVIIGTVIAAILVLAFVAGILIKFYHNRAVRRRNQSGSRNVEDPNDSSELVSQNRAAESEEPHNELPGGMIDVLETAGVHPAVDKAYSSNENLNY